MKKVFAPGCALLIYKPELGDRMFELLRKDSPGLEQHTICCRHDPKLPAVTDVINVCAGCDRRFRELYEETTTTAFWEILADSDTFPLPDYQGRRMSILDACPTRDQERVHKAVRTLLNKMNIVLVEPGKTATSSTCCGDSFFGTLPVEEVKDQMAKRAGEMPVDDVVVYCVSCIKAMHIDGKQPRYLVDLLFGESTHPGTFEPEQWHAELDAFIDKH
jgi:Fe-S oxidoreductase